MERKKPRSVKRKTVAEKPKEPKEPKEKETKQSTLWVDIDRRESDGVITETMAMPCGTSILIRTITRFSESGRPICMSEAIHFIENALVYEGKIIKR